MNSMKLESWETKMYARKRKRWIQHAVWEDRTTTSVNRQRRSELQSERHFDHDHLTSYTRSHITVSPSKPLSKQGLTQPFLHQLPNYLVPQQTCNFVNTGPTSMALLRGHSRVPHKCHSRLSLLRMKTRVDKKKKKKGTFRGSSLYF